MKRVKKYIYTLVLILILVTGCTVNYESSGEITTPIYEHQAPTTEQVNTSEEQEGIESKDETPVSIETTTTTTRPIETTTSTTTKTTTTSKKSIINTTKTTTAKKTAVTKKKTTTVKTTEATTEFVCKPKESKKDIPVYIKANCIEEFSDEGNAIMEEMVNGDFMGDILVGKNNDSPAYIERNKCDKYFNERGYYWPCYDKIILPEIIYDSTSRYVYGYAIKFEMYYDSDDDRIADTLIAKGYIRADKTVKYTMKDIPY